MSKKKNYAMWKNWIHANKKTDPIIIKFANSPGSTTTLRCPPQKYVGNGSSEISRFLYTTSYKHKVPFATRDLQWIGNFSPSGGETRIKIYRTNPLFEENKFNK